MDTVELATTYLKAKEAAGLSSSTLKKYRYLVIALAEESPSLPLDPDYLQDYVKRYGGQAPDSLQTAFRTLRTFYTWLIRRGYLESDRDPFLLMERPGGKSPIPRVLSVEELRRVVEVSLPPYNRALLLVLLDTCCRIGELASRAKEHLSGGTLSVYGKTGGRLVPVSPDVYGYLMDLPTDSLFPVLPWGSRGEVLDQPAAVSTLKGRVRRMMKRAGLGGRKLGPHTLRHSSATAYVNCGGDLKSLSLILGHTTTRMSERYVTLAMDSLRQKHATFGVLQSLRSGAPAIVQEELPQVVLPQEALDYPWIQDGALVQLFLMVDRRKWHTFYYIKARLDGIGGSSKWRVCSLGTDLPLNIVDAYRQEMHRENAKRRDACSSVEHVAGHGAPGLKSR